MSSFDTVMGGIRREILDFCINPEDRNWQTFAKVLSAILDADAPLHVHCML